MFVHTTSPTNATSVSGAHHGGACGGTSTRRRRAGIGVTAGVRATGGVASGGRRVTRLPTSPSARVMQASTASTGLRSSLGARRAQLEERRMTSSSANWSLSRLSLERSDLARSSLLSWRRPSCSIRSPQPVIASGTSTVVESDSSTRQAGRWTGPARRLLDGDAGLLDLVDTRWRRPGALATQSLDLGVLEADDAGDAPSTYSSSVPTSPAAPPLPGVDASTSELDAAVRPSTSGRRSSTSPAVSPSDDVTSVTGVVVSASSSSSPHAASPRASTATNDAAMGATENGANGSWGTVYPRERDPGREPGRSAVRVLSSQPMKGLMQDVP